MDNTIENFWKKYLKADYLERHKTIEKYLAPGFFAYYTIWEKDKKLAKHAVATFLQSYIDDLIMVMEEKNG